MGHEEVGAKPETSFFLSEHMAPQTTIPTIELKGTQMEKE